MDLAPSQGQLKDTMMFQGPSRSQLGQKPLYRAKKPSFLHVCITPSRVPLYMGPPDKTRWFIMRVRTTSTGLEASAPASPHVKLELSIKR